MNKELVFVRDLKIDNFLTFTKAIISTKDRIFPYKNMSAFWGKTNADITEIEAPHYIFDRVKNWSDLI